MTPEAQRIAIAEGCPNLFWVHKTRGVSARVFRLGDHPCEGDNECDLLNDLNAMHEAEKLLTDDQFDEQYVVELGRLFFPKGKGPFKWRECPTMVVRATAAQRAEAFLRTIGKWEESP